MAECIVLKGGGGADLDVITAGAGDVVSPKVTVDKDGNPVTGTMVERGAYTDAIVVWSDANNFSVQIPNGAYRTNSSSEHPEIVTPTAKVRASLGVESWKFRADTSIGGVPGGIPLQGAEVSSDRAWATNMSNWAGTINLGVRNGHFLNGVNWIQQDIPNYQPWNIKKGVNIGGVVGTFEGYIPDARDLYYRGNNVAGFVSQSNDVSFETGQMKLLDSSANIYATWDNTGKSYLNIQAILPGSVSNGKTLLIANEITQTQVTGIYHPANTEFTISLDIRLLQQSRFWRIRMDDMSQLIIYRIWLS